MSPPYIAFMSRQRPLTCHRGIIQGLWLLRRVPDTSQQGCRRHHQHTRTLFHTKHSRFSSITSGQSSTVHCYQSPTLSRRHQSTTTPPPTTAAAEQSAPATKYIVPKRRRLRTDFTAEENAKILEMRLEGATWKEIGDALGTEAGACHLQYKKALDPQLQMGWTEASKEKLNSMVARREPWRKIALQLHLSPQVCREKWMELNKARVMMERMAKMEERRLARKKMLEDAIASGDKKGPSRQRWTPTLDALMLDLHGRGWTWRQIGRTFGVVPAACFNRYSLTLQPKLKAGWTPPPLNEAFLPYYLRKGSGTRHPPHAPSNIVMPNDPSGQIVSRWYARQQMAKILEGELDATLQPDGGAAPLPSFLQPSSAITAVGDDFPAGGAHHMQPARREWSSEEDEAIVRLHKEGHSFHVIARVLGLRARQVSSRFHTVLDPGMQNDWTPETLDRLDFYVRQGLSWTTISNNLGKRLSVCKAKWEELQRSLKPLSSKVEGESAGTQSQELREGHPPPPSSSSSTSSSELPPQEATSSSGSAVLSSVQDQSQQSEEDVWSDEVETSHNGLQSHTNADLVDEYDNDDQDDYADSHEEDDYFEDNGDDEEEPSLIFDHERDETSNTRRRKPKAAKDAKEPSSLSPSSLPSSYWDDNAVLRAIGKNWTPEDETALIQHVLKHGPRDWDLISRKIQDGHAKRAAKQQGDSLSPTDDNTDPLGGHQVLHHERYSPEECQAYWKHLDLPVRRQGASIGGAGAGSARGGVQQIFESDKQQMARFWQLWLELGSDFDTIASRISEGAGGQDEDSTTQDLASPVTAAQCRQYFEEKTKPLHQSSPGTDQSESNVAESDVSDALSSAKSVGSQDSPVKDDGFHASCVKLAEALAEEPKFQWTKERSVRLQKLVRQRLRTRGVQLHWVNWKWVARHVGGGVTPTACSSHWRSLRQISAPKQTTSDQSNLDQHVSPAEAPWTEEEILLLEQGVRDVGVNENAIIGPSMFLRTLQRFYLPHRSVSAIQKKYFTLSDKAVVVTLKEYSAIMEAVDAVSKETLDQLSNLDPPSAAEVVQEIYAPSSSLWDKVVQRMSKKHHVSGWTKAPVRRVFESSHQHYRHFKASSWTRDEDEDLIKIVQWLGPGDWLSVARFFPDRSEWECRLRWCSLTDEIDLAKDPSEAASHPA